MTDKKSITHQKSIGTVIHELPQSEHNPGYQLFGAVIVSVDGNKTLELSSVVPGAKHPDPHKLVSVTLPHDGFSRLIELLKPHTKP